MHEQEARQRIASHKFTRYYMRVLHLGSVASFWLRESVCVCTWDVLHSYLVLFHVHGHLTNYIHISFCLIEIKQKEKQLCMCVFWQLLGGTCSARDASNKEKHFSKVFQDAMKYFAAASVRERVNAFFLFILYFFLLLRSLNNSALILIGLEEDLISFMRHFRFFFFLICIESMFLFYQWYILYLKYLQCYDLIP